MSTIWCRFPAARCVGRCEAHSSLLQRSQQHIKPASVVVCPSQEAQAAASVHVARFSSSADSHCARPNERACGRSCRPSSAHVQKCPLAASGFAREGSAAKAQRRSGHPRVAVGGAARFRSNRWIDVSNMARSADRSGSTHLPREPIADAQADGRIGGAAPALERLFPRFLQQPPAEPDQRFGRPESV